MFGNFISSYSRSKAIEDGVLIDVSLIAKQVGIKFPVAVTQKLWSNYIVPNKIDKKLGQSEDGRLWDVLSVFKFYASCCGKKSIMRFPVLFILNGKSRKVVIKSIVHPGDNFEPVITLMLPNED